MSGRATPFDILGPLPRGVAVLEASAGTGKTFTIAALAARYVAEGVPLDGLLIVTFTRMATGELRERVRERLVSAERALDDALAGTQAPAGDEVAALLAEGSPEVVRERRDRLARAVATFDAATITTTHGFCLEALGSLGFTGDVGHDCAFVEDVTDLVDQVVDDLYVRAFGQRTPVFSRREAGEIARAAVGNPAAHLVPEAPPAGSIAARRLGLARAARAEVERRKRLAQVMTYDDLLTRLHDALHGATGDAVAERLRARYRVVLVDEFQDTDPVQWSIMRRAFDHPGGTLVLIGDPKQAIYAFRGADVYAYLEAARTATTRHTLATNWRSDQGLIDAFDRLFGPAALGHPGIVYREVGATAANQRPRLVGAPVAAPLRLRVVDRGSPAVGLTNKGYAKADGAREHVALDVANDIAALLGSGAQIERRTPDGAKIDARAVRPGDIAVLVRRNRDAAQIREMLEDADVPAVINGAGSVFLSDAARDWLRVLEALERPTSAPRAHAAALTLMVGWDAARVASADDDAWEGVHRRLHEWAHVLRTAGVASLVEAITLGERLPRRVLAVDDGERALTDLRHVGQLLHAAASADGLGVSALTAWLRRRIADAERDADEERSRRLESDAAAVQVLTIHRSKGLEFPIVYYPSLWDPSWIPRTQEPVFLHDPTENDRRTLDVGLDGSAYEDHVAQHREELRGEDLRLMYVALTRAQHQAVVWWAGTWDARNGPLTRLVFARQEDGTVPPDGFSVPEDQEALVRFGELAAAAPGCVSVEISQPRSAGRWTDVREEVPGLEAATFDRGIDRTWRRTSYSDLTHGASEPRVGSEPEEGGVGDEHDEHAGIPVADDDGASALREIPSPLADMPGGTQVGTLVHELFEAADFAAGDLEAELGSVLAVRQARRPLVLGDEAGVVRGLSAALRTPLGPLAGGLALTDVARGDRLDELTFELPLVGGDAPAGGAVLSPAALAATLRDALPVGDPLRAYADLLAAADVRGAFRGFLTGSIDLVYRRRAEDGGARYGVVDYKTNRLGDHVGPLTVWDYRPQALRAEMFRSHYALQGLLYSVALHRYLRWRDPRHDPDRDLDGIFYLFVRGMLGTATPEVGGERCGVFAWQPPAGLVGALSDRLDAGSTR